MKKSIVLILALVLLPLNLAFAAPAGSGQSDLRTQLEQAQARKAEQLHLISLEAQLMQNVLDQSNPAPMPVASLDAELDQETDI